MARKILNNPFMTNAPSGLDPTREELVDGLRKSYSPPDIRFRESIDSGTVTSEGRENIAASNEIDTNEIETCAETSRSLEFDWLRTPQILDVPP